MKNEELVYKAVGGCTESAGLLIENNKNLIFIISRKYYDPKNDEEKREMLQQAYIGIINALNNFNINLGLNFFTYADFWIKKSISEYKKFAMEEIRTPTYFYDLSAKIFKFKKDFFDINYKVPTEKEIQENVTFNNKKVPIKTIKFINQFNEYSFNSTGKLIGDGNTTLGELISVECSQEKELLKKEKCEEIKKALETLDARDKKIIELRYGLDGGKEHTLRSVAKILNLSGERVRQIESKILKRLKYKICKEYRRN